MNEIQMNMDFRDESQQNRLKEGLNRGEFTLLFECSTPSIELNQDAVVQKIVDFEAEVLKIEGIPTGVALADGINSGDSWRAADFVTHLTPENRDRHLLYISGKNSDSGKVRELISIGKAAGICNFMAVSGNGVYGENVKETRKRNYFESIHILEDLADDMGKNQLNGAVVNPFQYTNYSQMAQNNKLIKKINSGASLIVSQAGWDMLKIQSLRWFMNVRELCIPTIERLVILTPERVEKILAGRYPGINISPDFHALLEREMQFSSTQFEAAQWRRLELQVAGCKLLGFNGIQLAGIDNITTIKVAAERIKAALNEFSDFEYWLSEYNSYLAKTEMAPFTGSFYLFDRILKRNYPEEPPIMSELGAPDASCGDKFKYFLRRFFLANASKERADNSMFFKKMLCQCSSCKQCSLTENEFICTQHCPKKLTNGACGGVKPDGSCEFPEVGECIHRRIARVAHWRNEATDLEDRIVSS